VKLILHIGTEKSGTTTIQKYLHRNSHALAQQGIVYSSALGRPNNIDIAVYGMNLRRDEPFFDQRAIFDEAGHDAYRRALAKRLAAETDEAAASGAKVFVISNEHCHSRLTTLDEVGRVHELLSPHFGDIEIICYLRPQVDLAVSHASTLARQARVTAEHFASIDATDTYFDYEKLLDRWAAWFGSAAITPVAFFGVDNPAADFARRIGADGWEQIPNDRSNSALDVNAIALLNAMEAAPHILPGRVARHPLTFAERLPVIDKLRLPQAAGRDLQAKFSRSNGRLVDKWPTISEDDLEPDWSHYDEMGNLDKLVLDDAVALQVKAMVNEFCRKNWLLEAELNLANSQRAHARGNLANARQYNELAASLADLVRLSFGETPASTRLARQINKQSELLARDAVTSAPAPR
jgi:hypothetical protein